MQLLPQVWSYNLSQSLSLPMFLYRHKPWRQKGHANASGAVNNHCHLYAAKCVRQHGTHQQASVKSVLHMH